MFISEGHDCTNKKNNYSLCQYKQHGNCVHVFNNFKDVQYKLSCFVKIHKTIPHKIAIIFT